MSAIITKKFRFEAAHYLPLFPEGHKCRRLHGHSFLIEVKVKGQINPETGIIMDFGDIKKATKPYIQLLDHYCLNEVGAMGLLVSALRVRDGEGLELLLNLNGSLVDGLL